MKSGRDSYLQFFRYYHTLKNFKLNQVLAYFTFKYRRKYLTILDLKSISKISSSLKDNFKFEDKDKFFKLSFFNKTIEFNIEKMNWNNNDSSSEIELQWLEYLNSFEWLLNREQNRLSFQTLSFLILDWISNNSDELSFSWSPFVVSKRLSSWVTWIKQSKVPKEITSIIKLSISLQLQRLFVDFEYHLPANHLLENCRGFLAGCFFLIESRQFFNNELEFQLEKVIEESIRQIQIQILKDGAHFERSPMYHFQMLEVIKDIRTISLSISKEGFLLPDILEKSAQLRKICEEKIPKMEKWLSLMTMPDGEIAQFNDSRRIKGIVNEEKAYEKLLEDSGFFVKHSNDYSFVMSCGSASPCFCPEHTHCDILSYELSIKGNRVIVDTGCSWYDNKTLRQMSRETESHNLPMVQSHDQSDIWGIFAIGKRAIIIKRNYITNESRLETLIKDQFGQEIERKIIFSDKSISFLDSLNKRRMEGCFISLIHLSPEVSIESIEKNKESNIVICTMTKNTIFSIITKANIRVDDYICFPDFGKAVSAKKLILSDKEAERLSYDIKW